MTRKLILTAIAGLVAATTAKAPLAEASSGYRSNGHRGYNTHNSYGHNFHRNDYRGHNTYGYGHGHRTCSKWSYSGKYCFRWN